MHTFLEPQFAFSGSEVARSVTLRQLSVKSQTPSFDAAKTQHPCRFTAKDRFLVSGVAERGGSAVCVSAFLV